MSKIVTSSDLTSANTDNMDNLELVIETSGKVETLLQDFVSTTPGTLKGTGYDMIRVKVSLYQKAYSTLKSVAENLKSILNGTNNNMINYMEGYSYLDDSKVPEMEALLQNIAAYLRYLSDKSSSTGVDYSAEINRMVDLYNKIYHYKELLKGLSSKDNELFGTLENIITDVENVARMVDGINESTFTKEGLEALKNGSGSIYNFDKDKQIFTDEYKNINTLPDIDTSNMSARAQQILNMLMETWPEDLEEGRAKAIETALSLLDKGITYSMDYRHAKDKNGNPTSMDCSSFVTYCLREAGVDITASAYTGTYLGSNNFTTISRSDLRPGDVGLINSSTSGWGGNHIGMYIGRDNNGNEVWIECTGSKAITVSTGKGNWSVFRRYNGF